MIILYALILIIQIGFGLFILFLLIAFITGGPFVPSSLPRAKAMVDIADIHEGTKIIDIGSGDGRVLFLAADRGAKAIGFEINPFLVFYTFVKALIFSHTYRVKVKWKNLWNSNVGEADVVFVYLIPWKMEDLEKKLYKELKPGSLIVTNSFMFPQKTPVRTNPTHHIYVYKV